MKLTVKNLEGRSLNVEVPQDCSVEKLKAKISEHNGVDPAQQKLIFMGKHLTEGHRLDELRVQEGSILHLVVRSLGGLRKESPNTDVVILLIPNTSNP